MENVIHTEKSGGHEFKRELILSFLPSGSYRRLTVLVNLTVTYTEASGVKTREVVTIPNTLSEAVMALTTKVNTAQRRVDERSK